MKGSDLREIGLAIKESGVEPAAPDSPVLIERAEAFVRALERRGLKIVPTEGPDGIYVELAPRGEDGNRRLVR